MVVCLGRIEFNEAERGIYVHGFNLIARFGNASYLNGIRKRSRGFGRCVSYNRSCARFIVHSLVDYGRNVGVKRSLRIEELAVFMS